MNTCPQCDSEMVFLGQYLGCFSGMPPHYFRPKGLKALVIGSADVPLKGRFLTACAECGLVWTQVDTKKLKQVLTKGGTKATRQKLGLRDGKG